jgi:hypothetical protein
MILSDSALVDCRLVAQSELLLAIEHVRQVALGSHRQPRATQLAVTVVSARSLAASQPQNFLK